MKTLIVFCVVVVFSLKSTAQVFGKDDKSKLDYANELYNQGKYSLVIEYCSDLILHNMRVADVFKLRANAYRALGNYTKAASDYGEAVQGSKDPQILIDRAEMFICIKEFDRADQDFNEVKRLLGSQTNYFKENFFITEEIGRLYDYIGDYTEAVNTFNIAINNGSSMAQIDLLGSLLHLENFESLRDISTKILNSYDNSFSLLSDSSLYYYVKAINDLSTGLTTEKTLLFVDNAINLQQSNSHCFQGYSVNLQNLKARIHSTLNQDSAAYLLYKKSYLANDRQQDVKKKINDLKIKLGIDAIPPFITIINPAVNDRGFAEVSSNNGKLEIYGKVTDSSGIATVMIDDKPVTKIEDDGIFVYNIDLNPGVNEIILTAIDKDDNRVDKKFSLNLRKEGDASMDTTDIQALFTDASFHAILIGENQYQDEDLADLSAPIKNVKELKEVLVKEYEFDEKNVLVLTDATGKQIEEVLESKAVPLNENDNLLIFYAGHGAARSEGSKNSGFLVPVDAKKGKFTSYLSSDELVGIIKYSHARHILLVIDACYGGAMFRSVSMDNAPPSIKQYYNMKSRKYLSSGNLEEVPDNGKFFESLMTFLKANNTRFTPAEVLASYIKRTVDGTVPQYNRIDQLGDFGGEFIFVKR